MSDIVTHRLANGVRLVLEPMAASRSVAINVSFGTGSRHERKEQAGLTHFCEHLVFKGTTRRDWKELARTMNVQGGRMNAFTSLDILQLHTRTVRADVEEALALMAEMVAESTFPEAEVERERGVILEEILEGEDTPEDVCFDAFSASLFGDHPVGRPVIGRRETVSAFSRDEALAFWRAISSGPNTQLSLAGDLDPFETIAWCERTFGVLDSQNAAPSAGEELPATAAGYAPIDRDFEQVQFCFGLLAPSRKSPDKFASALLDTILGGGMGSRLFNEVRERRGLVYSIGSGTTALRDLGFMTVSGGTSAESLPEVLRVCREEMNKLAQDGPTAEELATAQKQLERSYLLSLESCLFRAGRNGIREFYDEPHISDEEYIASLYAVTAPQLRDLAARIWGETTPALGLVGPLDGVAVESLPRLVRA